MALTKKLMKIGNSTGVIIPNDILQTIGLQEGSEVEIVIEKNGIFLKPMNLKDYKIMKTFLSVMEDYDETLRKLAK